MTTTYVKWGEATVKLTWKPGMYPTQYEFITSVHGFCFYKEQILLVDLNHRGWDFPGGHMEGNETSEECFKREAMEEGYVTGDCQLIGSIIVDHTQNQFWDVKGKYPKIGYQIFYRMDIDKLYPFNAEYESDQRILLSIDQIADYYHEWNELYQEILVEASNINSKRRN
ncbi:NUDIX domain-containing protein [Psychrobacillus sp. OK028]|uniref:NUDIX hydrolase n=1 Tax=Psychrobacillus sp. OK028 TaxID=1884359 RepID=UPI0008903625|nr:NUDIX domain-containing protein [Psychrobacillus sp. OK028]SDN87262.1 NUDIX domain-containing protein [Psychrobacillus sp. OK028]